MQSKWDVILPSFFVYYYVLLLFWMMKSQKKIYRRARVCSQELQDNITIEEIQLRLMSRTWFVCCSFFNSFFFSFASSSSFFSSFNSGSNDGIGYTRRFILLFNWIFRNYENENRKLFFNFLFLMKIICRKWHQI